MPPRTSAVVMAAKVIWKNTNTSSGIVPFRVSGAMVRRKSFSVPPMMGDDSVKAKV